MLITGSDGAKCVCLLIVGLGLGVLLFSTGLIRFGWNFSGIFSFFSCFVIIEN
jgi:hypothetical protein